MSEEIYNEYYNNCFNALICALKHKDLHTQLHSKRVLEFTKEIAEAFKFSKSETNILLSSALFHDIGKIGIPDKILLKPSKLDKEEWEIMKQHSQIGADIITNLKMTDNDLIRQTVLYHHEHFDGQGYPQKLSGNKIPLYSRILSVIDSYDAMTETRPYHKKRTHEEAISIMLTEKGKKSDPKILDKFLIIIKNSKNRVN